MPSGSFKYKCELWDFQKSPSQKIKGGGGQCTNLLPAKQLNSLLLNSSLHLRGWNLGECVSSYLEASGIRMWQEGPKYCTVSNGKCVLLSSLALVWEFYTEKASSSFLPEFSWKFLAPVLLATGDNGPMCSWTARTSNSWTLHCNQNLDDAIKLVSSRLQL